LALFDVFVRRAAKPKTLSIITYSRSDLRPDRPRPGFSRDGTIRPYG
jgi:hypothetical protein